MEVRGRVGKLDRCRTTIFRVWPGDDIRHRNFPGFQAAALQSKAANQIASWGESRSQATRVASRENAGEDGRNEPPAWNTPPVAVTPDVLPKLRAAD